MRSFGLYINGQYVHTGAFSLVIPPAEFPPTPFAQCAILQQNGPEEIMEAALQGAHETFVQIQKGFFPLAERLQFLKRFREKLASNADFLSLLLCQEVGKPLKLARVELQRALDVCDWTLIEAPRVFSPEGLPSLSRAAWQNVSAWVQREPRGPLLAITPFNYPVNLVLHKLVPAIAAGCPVILKPSPKSAATAMAIADTFHAAGLPPGMLSVLNTDNAVAERLIKDPRIQQISFTGSAAVGWKIRSQVSVPCFLEMGGNAPVYVDASANLGAAAEKLSQGGFSYAGQLCISVQNISVHPDVAVKFRELMIEATRKIIWGSPRNESVIAGGVIDAAAADRLNEARESALKAGARIVAEAGEPLDLNPETLKSNPTFLRPTLLEGAPLSHPFVSEELFGPYIHLDTTANWKTWAERINENKYRFQASLFTQDLSTAMQAAREIQFGSFFVNESTSFRMDPMPFGGRGQSGTSSEGPRYALEDYTERKTVVINPG